MKLLSLKPTINKVSTYIRNAKIEAKEKEIRSLVNLKEVTQPDAYEQLYEAREVLANYAKANNVRFIFETATKNVKPNEKRINVFAINQRHLDGKRINSDTKATEIVCRERPKFFQDKDGVDYTHKCIDWREDNFLRRVYRAVQYLTESVNKQG